MTDPNVGNVVGVDDDIPWAVLLEVAHEKAPNLSQALLRSCYQRLREYQFDRDSQKLSLDAVREIIDGALDD